MLKLVKWHVRPLAVLACSWFRGRGGRGGHLESTPEPSSTLSLCVLVFARAADSHFPAAEFRLLFPQLTGVLTLAFFIHNCVITIMKSNKNQENNVRLVRCGPNSLWPRCFAFLNSVKKRLQKSVQVLPTDTFVWNFVFSQVRDLSVAYLLVGLTYLYVGVLIFAAFPSPPLSKDCIEPVRLFILFLLFRLRLLFCFLETFNDEWQHGIGIFYFAIIKTAFLSCWNIKIKIKNGQEFRNNLQKVFICKKIAVSAVKSCQSLFIGCF